MVFLEKLQHAIEKEWAFYSLYKELELQTEEPLFKEVIHHAMEEEKEHYELFQYVHHLITGRYYQLKREPIMYSSFEEGIELALKGELEAVEMYKEMLFEIPNDQAHYPLFRAMIDELEHSTRILTMYSSFV